MTDIARALYTFWSGFEIPAYIEDAVPSSAELPYLTYTLTDSGWDQPTSHQVRVWYKGASYVDISSKVDEILAAVKSTGVVLRTENGCVVIRPSNPLVQYQPMDESDLKVAYLNFQLNCFV